MNRVREVKPQRTQPFLAVDIFALHGSADNVEYNRFDCRVSGKEAQEVIRSLMPAVEADRKVLVGFRSRRSVRRDLYLRAWRPSGTGRREPEGATAQDRLGQGGR